MRITENLQENFPFISVLKHVDKEYVGIIINQDSQITSMYDYSFLRTEQEKAKFLELGDVWWWESNRMIPINIFLRKEIEHFKYCIMTMNSKDVKVTIGPCVNLSNLAVKRIKRRSVQLVRRPK